MTSTKKSGIFFDMEDITKIPLTLEEQRKNERRDNLMSGIRSAHEDALKEAKEIETRMVYDSKENMRNLTLVSGGFATGTLVLLGTGIQVNSSLVIMGIVFLFLEVFVVFGYIFHTQKIEARAFLKNKKESLTPTAEMYILYRKYLEKKVTGEEFDEQTKALALGYSEQVTKNNENLINDDSQPDYFDIVFMSILGTGIVLIMLGLLASHLCSTWSMMCQ